MKIFSNTSLTQCWCNASPLSAMLAQHQTSTGSMSSVCWVAFNSTWSDSAYCWQPVQADTDPMSVKCWASVAGADQYPFSPSQYFILAGLRAHSIHQCHLNVGQRRTQWPGIGLMHITQTHCRLYR